MGEDRIGSETTGNDIVILKFGGTSVATPEGRHAIVCRVRETCASGLCAVVVVSAMGRIGAPYATDTLLSLVDDEVSTKREQDLLMGCGEIISSIVTAHELRGAGIEAVALRGEDAGIHTDGAYGCATIERIDTQPISDLLSSGQVPVVAGFQGRGPEGEFTTLGRGGSDTTAAALGVALGARSVDIYTDVDGVMTADPRIAGKTHVLERISADELFQMARSGSKVVHTPAAELAFASGAAIRVKNTFSKHEGTTVVDISSYRPCSVATAISNASDIARVRVTLPYVEDANAHMEIQTSVYEAMANAQVSLDMFTPVNDRLVFTVANGDLKRACDVIEDMGLDYKVRPDLAKVTLVGAGMHGVPGVMARMARYLFEAGVDVLQASDSHATISVLVRAHDMEKAVRALHDGFEL